MAFVCVDPDGQELIFRNKPCRCDDQYWAFSYYVSREHFAIELPKGSIAKLIGRELMWSDEPVQLKDE